MGFVAAATAAVAGAMSVKSSIDATNNAKKAQKQQKAALDEQTMRQDQAQKRANATLPDYAGMMKRNKAGVGNTMLTGAGGVAPTRVPLAKNTLLGG